MLKRIPRFAKVIMLAQSLLTLFLLFWAVEEYLNNYYFQAYVNNSLQGGTLMAVTPISIVAFTVVAVVLYMKLRKTRKELEGLLSTESVGPGGRGQILDNRTEQHLIEMIRKTTPIMSSGTGSGMPVLRRSRYPEEERSSQ